MTSLILSTAARYLLSLLLVFSVFILIRGHNEPGGGFIGGLIAAAAFSLNAIAFDAATTRRILRIDPRLLVPSGLLIALGSGIAPLLTGEPFLTGMWLTTSVPVLGGLTLGTPLIFDCGVYLVVLGVTMTMILTLAEE
jgi:multicomponent Na+:H+ antiporter subunit B